MEKFLWRGTCEDSVLNKRRHVSGHAVQLDGENLPRKVAVRGNLCHYTAGPNCATGQYVHSIH